MALLPTQGKEEEDKSFDMPPSWVEQIEISPEGVCGPCVLLHYSELVPGHPGSFPAKARKQGTPADTAQTPPSHCTPSAMWSQSWHSARAQGCVRVWEGMSSCFPLYLSVQERSESVPRGYRACQDQRAGPVMSHICVCWLLRSLKEHPGHSSRMRHAGVVVMEMQGSSIQSDLGGMVLGDDGWITGCWE